MDAQRESCNAYIASQRGEGWVAIAERYDDGGFSGGNLERPALRRLIADIQAGKIDVVICYKVDRLTRSLMDFSKLVDLFEKHEVLSFAAVTQNFSTTSSMGRLTLNILLSFAQFEKNMRVRTSQGQDCGFQTSGSLAREEGCRSATKWTIVTS